jgi:EpsI family protein
MNARACVVAVLMLVAGVARLQLQAVALGPIGDLEKLPLAIDGWQGQSGPPFDASVLGVLRPDAYVNRLYRNSGRVAGLYIGYHRAQRQGNAIHSPLNCLPGSGWQPIRTDHVGLEPFGSAKRVVIQKGEERQLVLYWYQSVGRIEGSEYWNKYQLVVDAYRSGRNDAALVRIVVPIGREGDGEAGAERSARELATRIAPSVTELLF